VGPRPSIIMITLRHTTLGKTPLDEWSVRRRDLYLTAHNTHKRRDIHASPRDSNPQSQRASERPQTHALALKASETGSYRYESANSQVQYLSLSSATLFYLPSAFLRTCSSKVLSQCFPVTSYSFLVVIFREIMFIHKTLELSCIFRQ